MELLDELKDDVIVSFDPGMLYVNKGLDFMNKLISYTDILLINETELLLTTNKKTIQEPVDEKTQKEEI